MHIHTIAMLKKLLKTDPRAWYIYAAIETLTLNFNPCVCLASRRDVYDQVGLLPADVCDWAQPLTAMGLMTVSPIKGPKDLKDVFICRFLDTIGPRCYSRTKEAKERLAKVMVWGKLTPAGDLAELLTKRATGILPSVHTSVMELADDLDFPPDVVQALLFILARAGFLSYWSPGICLLRPIDWAYEEGQTMWEYADRITRTKRSLG